MTKKKTKKTVKDDKKQQYSELKAWNDSLSAFREYHGRNPTGEEMFAML